ncbi:flagellar basal body L-ring protein FlgH [Iodidimonas sp. SYSU 1G8]|uniref:flagellar basal body L-ring protein FlgH n=1 Tax=Iodidimonas sp. SYSU 1G8 TaxID=3133967 RepID=UPI0031FE7BD7
MNRAVLILSAAALLSGCSVASQLSNVGRAPKMTAPEQSEVPVVEASLAMQGAAARTGAAAPPPVPATSASLFRTGAGAFFHDQRASRIGDILTVRIKISDKAEVGNSTTRSRSGSETADLGALLGLESQITKVLPGSVDPSKLVDTSTKSQSGGAGSMSRSEKIDMTMAAIVTGVLPNGNLLIRGRQEVRVNFELREVIVTGIVRPEDIARDNSIAHSQIAEARISYGGRGQLTDAQQARWGQQIYDALFPF